MNLLIKIGNPFDYKNAIPDESVNIATQFEDSEDITFIDHIQTEDPNIIIVLRVMYEYIKHGHFDREELIKLVAENLGTQYDIEALIKAAGKLLDEQNLFNIRQRKDNFRRYRIIRYREEKHGYIIVIS